MKIFRSTTDTTSDKPRIFTEQDSRAATVDQAKDSKLNVKIGIASLAVTATIGIASLASNWLPHPQQAEHKEPYRTICVVLVALGLAAVPAIALLGHRRIAVLWAAAGILMLAIVRIQRPDGTWLAARSRLFDVVLGIGLAAVLLLLSPYVNLPRIL